MGSAARKKSISEGRERDTDRAGVQAAPIVVRVTRQMDGYVYTLDIHSRLELEREHPELRLIPAVFIGTKSERDFEEVHRGKIWRQVALLLTGMPEAELRRRGVELREAGDHRNLGAVF